MPVIPDWLKFVLILVVFFIVYVIYMMFKYNHVRKMVLELQNSLVPGDLVVTQAGLFGTVCSIDKGTARLKIADNTVITIDRFTIKKKIEESPKAEKQEAKKK